MNDDIDAYAEAHSSPEPPVLAKLNRETNLSQVYPQMLSGHLQGTFLQMISAIMRPSRILEIGTFTGYSAIHLAMGAWPAKDTPADCGILHTIEINPEQEEMIREYIRKSEMEEMIVLHIGDAMEVIPEIDETWDLVFIDADKTGYLDYYNLVLPRLRRGGVIIADNVLWSGKVLDAPENMDRDTLALSSFNEHVTNDPRVQNLLNPLRDGLMMIRKL